MAISLTGARVVSKNEVVFDGLSPAVTAEPSSDPEALFLTIAAAQSHSRLRIDLGVLPELARFVICHRSEPYWMKPRTGTQVSEIAAETQMLLGQMQSGRYLLLVPLIAEPFRYFLRGKADQHLELVGETADSFRPGHGGLALFLATGRDPFELAKGSAILVRERFGCGKLRSEKKLPDFVDEFGWCTWDAFYSNVSAEKVQIGLESFRAGGVEPRMLILDDGWQLTARQPTGECRLVGFAANEKFPGGLSALVDLAKRQYRVEHLLVWHTILGYWGGVDENGLPDYGVIGQTRQFGEGILTHEPLCNQDWWGNLVGFVPTKHIGRFYEDYHRSLATQGVDGVKVDSQAMLEGLCQRQGGRVEVTMAYRAALEASVEKHFGGRLINCMSNSQETLYGSTTSTVMRTSIDFFPNDPASHGLHVYTNATVGLWFGEFMHPDWDMFQSGHAWGRYHAASRAISGGPVYCSDKPDGHDFTLLRQLVCSDGRVLRCDQPGLLTLDTLFRDPTREDVLLKIWNKNGRSGIVGIFNARVGSTAKTPLTTVTRASDVVGLEGEHFACFGYRYQELALTRREEALSISLGEAEFELLTFVPIENGFAPIGLVDKMNSAGAIESVNWESPSLCELVLRDGGKFAGYCVKAPTSTLVDGVDVRYSFDGSSGRLDLDVPPGAKRVLSLVW